MSLTGFPPKAFLIGALRTGSTYLASLLDRHPGIRLAQPKEPGYFTGNSVRGLDWYRGCFEDPEESILLDATAWYSAGPTERYPATDSDAGSRYLEVPRRMHELSPDARFLYLVRDPIERAHSLFWFLRRTGPERRSFLHAIREDPLYCRSSDYRGQLAEFLRYYPEDRFLIVSFDQLVASPQETANACYRFLGVEEFRIETEARHHERNASYEFRALPGLVARALGKPELVERAYRGMVKLTPRGLHRLWHRLMFRSHPPISEAERRDLAKRLAPRGGETDPSVEGFEIVREWEAKLRVESEKNSLSTRSSW